eukprot:COSAG04_NODE_881_length_9663_cov_30.524258_11_plen_215_part_00
MAKGRGGAQQKGGRSHRGWWSSPCPRASAAGSSSPGRRRHGRPSRPSARPAGRSYGRRRPLAPPQRRHALRWNRLRSLGVAFAAPAGEPTPPLARKLCATASAFSAACMSRTRLTEAPSVLCAAQQPPLSPRARGLIDDRRGDSQTPLRLLNFRFTEGLAPRWRARYYRLRFRKGSGPSFGWAQPPVAAGGSGAARRGLRHRSRETLERRVFRR